ncbi:hypothetical protein [Flavobacterium sp.]|uniref:hypothetical protein n=1 Tax=Flavobacterium sp. TaxID=239 RepID=UPI0025E019BA|nr:hypothetical protein [Flavobacterium sp.]
MLLEQTLNEKILKITTKISNDNPELLKYLNEMTVTIPDVNNPEINIKVLQDYYNSLEEMLKKYITNHQII